jgi:hypothetical protein
VEEAEKYIIAEKEDYKKKQKGKEEENNEEKKRNATLGQSLAAAGRLCAI